MSTGKWNENIRLVRLVKIFYRNCAGSSSGTCLEINKDNKGNRVVYDMGMTRVGGGTLGAELTWMLKKF